MDNENKCWLMFWLIMTCFIVSILFVTLYFITISEREAIQKGYVPKEILVQCMNGQIYSKTVYVPKEFVDSNLSEVNQNKSQQTITIIKDSK